METLISLYADDVILYLRDAEDSMPTLLELINSFRITSGYTINWSKSDFMSLSASYLAGFLETVPFKVVEDHLSYLGLTLPKNLKLILQSNFEEFILKLKQSIEYWRLLPLSMIGCINSIKMVSVPRFLYLCPNLPIFLTLDSIIISYIWSNKNPRISKVHLQKPKMEAVWACQLSGVIIGLLISEPCWAGLAAGGL